MQEFPSHQARVAQGALEQVCSGARVSSASEFYSADFVDHVNGATHRGYEGIQRSVQSYAKILSNIRLVVQDQVIATDHVTSRFTVTGRCYGREVSFHGITISRFSGDKIIEDWSVTDVLGMLKQLGWWRCLLIVFKH